MRGVKEWKGIKSSISQCSEPKYTSEFSSGGKRFQKTERERYSLVPTFPAPLFPPEERPELSMFGGISDPDPHARLGGRWGTSTHSRSLSIYICAVICARSAVRS